MKQIERMSPLMKQIERMRVRLSPATNLLWEKVTRDFFLQKTKQDDSQEQLDKSSHHKDKS